MTVVLATIIWSPQLEILKLKIEWFNGKAGQWICSLRVVIYQVLYPVTKLYPSKAVHNSEKTLRWFFLEVPVAIGMNPSILAYISAPLKVQKQFDIFCLTFTGLISLSARLFVNGTSGLKANAGAASFLPINRSTRFLPLVRLLLPFLPGIFIGGGSACSPKLQIRSYLDSMISLRLTLSSNGIL